MKLSGNWQTIWAICLEGMVNHLKSTERLPRRDDIDCYYLYYDLSLLFASMMMIKMMMLYSNDAVPYFPFAKQKKRTDHLIEVGTFVKDELMSRMQ